MYSSLHLSDLDQTRNSRISITPDQRKNVSQYLKLDSNRSQLSMIQKKSAKIKLYETKISNFERKLKDEKRKTVFIMKEKLDHLRDEENKIEKEFFDLQQSQQTIKQRKAQSDKLISEQKLILLELEDESKRLEKSNEWANSTFLFKKSSNYVSDSVLQMESQLSQVKMKIKDLRSKIFHYQKELLRISESLSPIRSQQYILQSRIDEAQNNKYIESTNKPEFQKSVMFSLNEQLLSLKKFKTEQSIKNILERINSIQDDKHNVMQKLFALRSSINDSLLKSIQEQVNQYREASARRRKLELDRQFSSHDAISKELDIKIELDSIIDTKKDILRQKEEITKSLKEKNENIARLEKTIAVDSEIVTSGPEAILKKLISSIQSERIESMKLNDMYSQYTQDKTESFIKSSIELGQSEIDDEKDMIDKKIKSVISDIEENNSQIQELNLKVKKENDTISQISESISFAEAHKPIIKTPKIILLNNRIADIQQSINKLKKKKEKKNLKISSLNNTLQSLIMNLDLQKTKNLYKFDVLERFERSMRWLCQMVNNNTRVWRGTGSVSMSTINEWETKVLLAALNEAEDLYVRHSIICS